jgi:hypothetical protein
MRKYYTKFPISEATQPPLEGCCWIYRDRYWATADDCLLFYMGQYPQCNRDESLTKRLPYFGKETRFIPVVYVPAYETHEGLEFRIPGEEIKIND